MILDTPFVDEVFGVNLTEGLELKELSRAKFGYDLRFIDRDVKDPRRFAKELAEVFLRAEEVFNPDFILLSKDHRRGNRYVVKAYEILKREATSEVIAIDGILSTTVPPFFAACISAQERAKILALHATASHNPPEYSGVKLWQGSEKEMPLSSNIDYNKKMKAVEVLKLYGKFLRQNMLKGVRNITLDLSWGAGSVLGAFFARYGFSVINGEAKEDFNGILPEPGPKAPIEKGFKADGDFDRAVLYIKGRAVNFSDFLLAAVKAGKWPFEKVVVDLRTPPVMVKKLEENGVKVVKGTTGRNYQELIASKVKAFWYEENWHTGGFASGGIYLAWAEAPLAVVLFAPLVENLEIKQSYQAKELRLKGVELPERLPGWKRLKYHKGFWRELPGGFHAVIRESKTEKATIKVYATGKDEKEAEENIKAAVEELKAEVNP